MKLSSSLFKKATAAEIFINNLEQKKKLNKITKKDNEKNIIKVGDGTLTHSQRKENLVLNLMSEPSGYLPTKGRRKSIEVLMKGPDSIIPISRPSNTRLDSQPSILQHINNSGAISPPGIKPNKKQHRKDVNYE